MSRRIDICPTCKGKGEIIVDNWLTEGRSEEELAKEAEEALADIVEVVRCKNCSCAESLPSGLLRCRLHSVYSMFGNSIFNVKPDDYCSYGERRANDGT